MSKSFYNFIDNEVSEIVTANLFKDERLISTPQQTAIKLSSGKEVLNFCANDYLGLANNDQIKKAASNSVVDDGFGMASVRFICCLLYTSPSPRDDELSRMPSSA